MTVDQQIGQQMTRALRNQGFSPVEIGSALGLQPETIVAYCEGRERIAPETLFALAEVLQMPVAEFFAGRDSADEAMPAPAETIH